MVMPFGSKAVPGQPGASFDFDKVYRVILRRAIEAAGMVPVRADESTASGIIHTDMFKALRDKHVVLAELSLHNPNVYYELGIRHVLASSGTVLMCSTGTPLPFDIALARVVQYDYDGVHLDWEEAERVIPILRQYLLDAQQGITDSPVHGLIYISESEETQGEWADLAWAGGRQLDGYQQQLGSAWRSQGREPTELLAAHGRDAFGARALGYFCLAGDPLPEEALAVASGLVDLSQYDLANQLFERVEDTLDYRNRLRFASSVSEANPTLAGVERAMDLIQQAIQQVQTHFASDPTGRSAALAQCFRREAGMLQWRWQLTLRPADLDRAIAAHQRALDQSMDARTRGGAAPVGLLAQLHLRLMILLRIRDGDRDRPDAEHHGDEILKLRADKAMDDETARSWLRWYKVLALADKGLEGQARDRAYEALRLDAQHADSVSVDVGNRQYFLLRRMIDQNSQWFRNPTAIGIVAQALQRQID